MSIRQPSFTPQVPTQRAPQVPAPRVPRQSAPTQAPRVPATEIPTSFSAMVVAADPYRRAMSVRRMRSLGARDVAEAGTVLQARAWARTAGLREVCIADALLPDGSGIMLLAELQRAGWAGCAIVPQQDAARAAHAALAARIRSCVLAGRATGAAPGADSEAARAAARLGLSDREVEVLRHVAEGRANRDVGEAMGLSALTIKSHLARIARKLGTGDRAGMVATAMRARAID
ncbi:MAG: response regulator transcription factor [Sporichthyaceae bacterium]